MTSRRIIAGLGLVLGGGVAAGHSMALEGDPERGQTAAKVCVACHQSDGRAMNVPVGGVLAAFNRAAGTVSAWLANQSVEAE